MGFSYEPPGAARPRQTRVLFRAVDAEEALLDLVAERSARRVRADADVDDALAGQAARTLTASFRCRRWLMYVGTTWVTALFIVSLVGLMIQINDQALDGPGWWAAAGSGLCSSGAFAMGVLVARGRRTRRTTR